MVALAVLRAPEVRSRQGRRRAALGRGSAEGQQPQPPEPLWRSNKEHQGKHILGEASLSGKEVAGGALRKEGSSTCKHSCAGPAQSSGQPSNLSPSATGGDAGGQEQPSQRQSSYPELSLPAQGWQWVHSLSTQSTKWAPAGL